MADLKVEVVKIDRIEEHPNADRMELAHVGGYQVCVQKDLYDDGHLAVYFPVDSVLNDELEAMIFGPDSKVKLHKHRVRAIKLRGALSEGMLVPIETVYKYLFKNKGAKRILMDEGSDLTELLDVQKYQPPARGVPGQMNVQRKAQRHQHPDFKKYTNINHLKKYWTAFHKDQPVWETEKLHGTNFRCGWVPFKPRTFMQKVKAFFGRGPGWEFVYGSHNVQLQDGKGGSAYENVYRKVVGQRGLMFRIPKGQVWYGEIIGDGIQKNYSYGYTDGEVDVYWMDIMDSTTGKYIDFIDVINTVKATGEKVVPHNVVPYNVDEIVARLNDPCRRSAIDGTTYPIEGFVIRPTPEQNFYGGRLILKLINDEYLLKKDNTDWH